MDCRTSLALALGLAACCTGCVAPSAMRCKTEVAFADFKAREAAASRDLAPGQREAIFEQARVAYQRALSLDPACKEAYAGLGRLYEEEGNEPKAAEVYAKVLRKYPRDPALWFARGLCDCRRKDWNGALEALEKAHGLDPDNRVYARTLGLTQARAGRCEAAVATLSQVMTPAEANYTVARMLHHLGQDDQGRQYLQAALRLNADLAGARELYARLDGAAAPAAAPVATIGFVAAAPGESAKQ